MPGTGEQSAGVAVAGSSCVFEGGVTTMKFTRAILAARGGGKTSALTGGTQTQRSITLGTEDNVVFAVGKEGSTSLSYHAYDDRGSVNVDIKTGGVTVVGRRAGEGACLSLSL